MSDIELPKDRKASSGRTFNSPWDAGTVGPGAAIQRPMPSATSPYFDLFCFVAALALLGWMFWMGLGMPRPW